MEKKFPNIVFILIDDMGWRDLKACGSTFYETPRIDRLMQEGMQFTNAYATCPVCSPSRGSILTGRYPATLGLTDWIDHCGMYHPAKGLLIDAPYIKHLPIGEKTLAQTLKEHGYRSYHVGKWHLGMDEYFPERFGFDVNIGGCDWGHPHDGYYSPYGIRTLTDGPEGEYLTDRITDEAIKLIHEESGAPFFLNLWHYAVHIPIEAPQEDVLYFQEKARRLGLDTLQALVEGEHFPTELKCKDHVRRRMFQSDPVYAAMILNLDKNIGRVMDALEETGKRSDTLVIFTSDNGGLSTSEGSPTCNLPASEGKGWMYDGGIRVPLSFTWPGHIPCGTHCDGLTVGTDFYPTILELLGLPLAPEQHCDGTSIVPLLEGMSMPVRPLFWHYPHYGNQGGRPASAVRKGRFKLIQFFEDDHVELYDTEGDIGEDHDISAAHPDLVEELLGELEAWRKRIHAKLPMVNPDSR